MTPERQTLIERIRAMQAKAENEASTEAEAMQAAAMAARLMSKHEVTDEELSIIEAGGHGVQMQRVNHGTKRMHFAAQICRARYRSAYRKQGICRDKLVRRTTAWCLQGLDRDLQMANYLSLAH